MSAKDDADGEHDDSFGRYGGFIQRAIPLVVIPTLIGLAGMLWIDWNNAATRNLWLAEAGCIAAILVLTMAFAARAVPVDQASAKLDTGLFVHNFRIALAFVASSLGVWLSAGERKRRAEIHSSRCGFE